MTATCTHPAKHRRYYLNESICLACGKAFFGADEADEITFANNAEYLIHHMQLAHDAACSLIIDLQKRIEALESRNSASACPHCKGEGRSAVIGNDGERVMAAYCTACLPPGMQRA